MRDIIAVVIASTCLHERNLYYKESKVVHIKLNLEKKENKNINNIMMFFFILRGLFAKYYQTDSHFVGRPQTLSLLIAYILHRTNFYAFLVNSHPFASLNGFVFPPT